MTSETAHAAAGAPGQHRAGPVPEVTEVPEITEVPEMTGMPEVADGPARFVVTGASGFIGRRLCARLQSAGASVMAILRTQRAAGSPQPWNESVVADLSSGKVPHDRLRGARAMFHLAGRAHAVGDSLDDDTPYLLNNVEGTRNALQAAVDAGIARFIFVSSVKAMGEGGEQPLDADSPCEPRSACGRSKLAAEELALDFGEKYGLDVRIIRPCMVHGPGNRGNLQRMFDAVAGRRFPPLRIVNNRRSMVHVDDLIEALMRLAERDGLAGRRYVIAGPSPVSTWALYQQMRASLGRAPMRWSVPLSLLRPVAVLGDLFERLSGRRLPLDSTALARLTESACYAEEALRRDTGFACTRDLGETLAALALAYQPGVAEPGDGSSGATP